MSLSKIRKRLFPGHIFYGWYIAWAGAGTNCVVVGVTHFAFGIFLEQFRTTYGWSMTALALGYSIRVLEQGLFAPFTGYIADRVGPRRMATAGIWVIAISLLIFTQAKTLTIYYIASVVMALGQSIGGGTAYTLAVVRWFVRRRGNAVSIVVTGHSLAYFAPLIVTALIASFGFHEAFYVLALTVLAVGLPLARVIRDRPEDLGLQPDGDDVRAAERTEHEITRPERTGHSVPAGKSIEVRAAVRSATFYALVTAMAAGQAAQLVWVVFQVPHLVAQGFSVTFAATQGAIYGLTVIPMRWMIGWLGDRFGRSRGYTLGVVLEGLGLCFFAFVTPERWWLLIPFYLVFGMGHCCWAVFNSALPADYFGSKNFATLRGLINTFQVPVAVLTPLLMGSFYDSRSSYSIAYLIVAALVIAGALCLTLVRRPLVR